MKRLMEFGLTESALTASGLTASGLTASGLAGLDGLADPGFSDAVIGWQRAHGRHTLPWQNTRDAYRVWLSEIMLQQTQVAAVLGYYARFLDRFPTVQDLASAPIEDVMAHWSGLGYYTRARNLHACAIRVVRDYGGVFPADPALLADLPGIGRSTAAAITAFSNGTRAAILDGNVKRVFARVFGVEGYPGEKRIEDALWRRADALLPQEGIESYTQGLMDLGATLCTRSKPDCGRCPLQARCVAYATGRTAELPVRKPKKASPEKRADMLVVVHGGQVLLEQRPGSGIWGGLLSLPEVGGHVGIETPRDAGLALAASLPRFGDIDEVQALLPLVHVFTHYKLHMYPHKVTLAARGDLPAGHAWVTLSDVGDAALPAPVKKLLLELARPSLFS